MSDKLTADKLWEVTEKIPRVYDAGIKDLALSGKNIIGVAKDESITITDISSVEHIVDIEVKVIKEVDALMGTTKVFEDRYTSTSQYAPDVYVEWAEEDGKYPNRAFVHAGPGTKTGQLHVYLYETTLEAGTYKFISDGNVYAVVGSGLSSKQREAGDIFSVAEECECSIYMRINYSDTSTFEYYVTTKLLTDRYVAEDANITVTDANGQITEYTSGDVAAKRVKSTYPTMAIETDVNNAMVSVEYVKDLPRALSEEYDAGKKSEYDTFWDAFQENGNREPYSRAFASVGWSNANFKPKYDINCVGSCEYMFGFAKYLKGSLTDILGGVKLDTSKATNLDNAFVGMRGITEFPFIDLSKCSTRTANLFNGNIAMTKIEGIKFNGNVNNTMFTKCAKLTHFIASGTIKTSGLDLHWSTKLDKETAYSIMNILSKTAEGCNVTFPATLLDLFSDENEWYEFLAIAPNWSVSTI